MNAGLTVMFKTRMLGLKQWVTANKTKKKIYACRHGHTTCTANIRKMKYKLNSCTYKAIVQMG